MAAVVTMLGTVGVSNVKDAAKPPTAEMPPIASATIAMPSGVRDSGQAETPRMVTDIAPVHGLVSMVMGEEGTPDLLLPPGVSPHCYAMRPSNARGLGEADLVIWIGEGLTPWLEGPLETLAYSTQHLTLMDVPGTEILEMREGGIFGGHDHDHDHDHNHDDAHEEGHEHEEGHDHEDEHAHGHEDDHSGSEKAHSTEEEHEDEHHDGHEGHDHDAHHQNGDPHLWLSPENATLWLNAIADRLAQLDPEGADRYRANAAAAVELIDDVSAGIDQDLMPVKDRPFVVLHDGFHYFEDHFGLTSIAAVKSAEADQPGPARMSDLRAALRESGAVCALSEPQIDSGLLDTAIEGLDIGRGTIDPLGAAIPLGQGHYPALLAAISKSLLDCLSR